MDPFIGQILLVAYNFAPIGWHICDGSLLQIAQYSALFTLLGTTYGGDGKATFGLPDLRGRVPVGFGQGQGLSSYNLGESAGSETVTLLTSEMPNHTHLVQANTASDSNSPVGNFPADSGSQAFSAAGGSLMAPTMVTPSGGGQPHENLQPYLAMNYIIALQGIWPSRQ